MAPALREVLAALERIAPLALADDWDNVGLLIDGPDPLASIARCLLTIDLTEEVLDEAIAGEHPLIVAYHPPIFAKLSRLRGDVANERVVLRAVRAGIAVYSPHTALDATPGGVNDWLADGLGEGTRASLAPAAGRVRRRLEARLHPEEADALTAFLGLGTVVERDPLPDGTHHVRGVIDTEGERALSALPQAIRDQCELSTWTSPERPETGQGRQVDLRSAMPLAELVRTIKGHLRLKAVRVASAPRHAAGELVSRVLICAGAGGSVLAPRAADVYWTGEMRHHDVLAAIARGTSVVLCDHSNTERGYLPLLRGRLLEELGRGIDIVVAKSDREPMEFA